MLFAQSKFLGAGAHGLDGQGQKFVQLKSGFGTLPDVVPVDTGRKGLVFHFFLDASDFHALHARGAHKGCRADKAGNTFATAQGVVKAGGGLRAIHFSCMGAYGRKGGLGQMPGQHVRCVQPVA